VTLEEEATRATEMLHGKVVRAVWRHRPGEVWIEFVDETRLFVDTPLSGALEVCITDGLR
jgi:hypothetical protein